MFFYNKKFSDVIHNFYHYLCTFLSPHLIGMGVFIKAVPSFHIDGFCGVGRNASRAPILFAAFGNQKPRLYDLY